MKRSLTLRTSALLWTIIFLLSTAGEGFGFHPCPYHDSLGSEGQVADTGAHHDGHEEHHEHPGDAPQNGVAHQSASGAHGHSHGADSEPCTHVDVCPPAGAVLPVEVERDFISAYVSETPAAAIPVERLAVAYPPYFLPYSNGPPALG